MKTQLARSWWSLAIRGLVAILLGISTFLWPSITVVTFVLLFGAYALIDGVVNLIGAWRAAEAHERWAPFLIEGIVGIIAAVVTILYPAVTALVLVYIVAAWALVTGVFEIIAAIRLRKYITGEWLLALTGVASIIFGVMLVAFPVAATLVFALWFGIYCLIFGALMIGLAFRLRSWAARHHSTVALAN
jgi:uncharacterized membrane protein HdeD (DUF308 family)